MQRLSSFTDSKLIGPGTGLKRVRESQSLGHRTRIPQAYTYNMRCLTHYATGRLLSTGPIQDVPQLIAPKRAIKGVERKNTQMLRFATMKNIRVLSESIFNLVGLLFQLYHDHSMNGSRTTWGIHDPGGASSSPGRLGLIRIIVCEAWLPELQHGGRQWHINHKGCTEIKYWETNSYFLPTGPRSGRFMF